MVRGREIIDADVDPAHRGPSPQLRALLAAWTGIYYWVPQDGPGRLVLIRTLERPGRERWWLHAALFLATFITVAVGGALLAPEGLPGRGLVDPAGAGSILAMVGGWLGSLRPGLEFAMALMAILLTHECGHYFVAQRYRINASPPYFLPAPWFNFVGTFGAFIRLRSPIADRRQLMDVGAAGPWAGLVIALMFLVVGLMRSHAVQGFDAPFVVLYQGGPILLGDSLLTWAARHWIVGPETVHLHPLAMAGWVGVFVTALNLLPLGQLDGGHVLYALIGDRQRTVGRAMWLALIPLGLLFWGWWVWALLILVVSRGRLGHPSVLDRHRRIPASRTRLGWVTMILFLLTFMPAPFPMSPFHM